VIPGCPKYWVEVLKEWASAHEPIKQVYLFGSRVKGGFQHDSDLDVGLVLDGSDPDTTWIINARKWRASLESRIPINIDLHFCDFKNDEIVGPSIKDHGLRVYSRSSTSGG
jgi:predicted nucleotidyltransferase